MRQPIRFPPVNTDYFPFEGGLDLESPAISVGSGRLLDCQNYVASILGGYRRIYGFERFDGRTSPTSAAYWVMSLNITGVIANGNIVTGATSGATGKVLGLYGSVLVMGRVTGVFISSEIITIAASPVATTISSAIKSGAPDPANNANYKLLAANDRRVDIQAVPGSGPIRGVHDYNDVVYAWRDNVGATAGDIYKQSLSGWVQVPFGQEIQFLQRQSVITVTIATPGVVSWANHGLAANQGVVFSTTGALPTGLTAGTPYYLVSSPTTNEFALAATVGGVAIDTTGSQSGVHTATLVGSEIVAGNTVIGGTSGASAPVVAVMLRTGTWTVEPKGTLILGSVTGAFLSGEALQVGGNAKVQSSSANTAITRLPGGRVETVTDNFTGAAATKRIYGADGVNLAFEFDGTNYIPIRTGQPIDTPSHVAIYRNYLFLSYFASFQLSAVGAPYTWTSVLGAAEIATGSLITGMVPKTSNSSGASMAIFTEGKTFILYGTSPSTFQLLPSIADLGYAAYTVQDMGNDTWGLTARGVQALITTQNYGDFQYKSITFFIQRLMNLKRGKQIASSVSKANDEYRLYFNDGTAISIGLTGDKISGIMPLNFGSHVVRCTYIGQTSTGEEVSYFGSDDGYVYRDGQGTSFDGDAIESWIRPVFNNLQSPRIRKQYRRAVFEVETEGYAEVSIGYDLGYATPNVSQGVNSPLTLIGTGGYWDQVMWDNFIWSTQTVNTPDLSLDGTETNISFLFYSKRAQDESHTVQGVNLAYTPRRLSRGS